jgi:hypothetical protein
VPVSTYLVDEATTDIRALQQMPTTGLIEADDSTEAPAIRCTTVCCRYLWTC